MSFNKEILEIFPNINTASDLYQEALDSLVGTEFWYAEGNSRGKGRVESNSWWLVALASPRVPAHGLSNTARQKLLSLGNLVHQVFKAAKSINENVLHEMPVAEVIHNALPKASNVYFSRTVDMEVRSSIF